MFLHLFKTFQISFKGVLYFSVYKPYTSSAKFIPKYLILFGTIANEIVFGISFFGLFNDRNTIEFCRLILCPATLLNSLGLRVCVCVCSKGFLCTGSRHLWPLKSLLTYLSTQLMIGQSFP